MRDSGDVLCEHESEAAAHIQFKTIDAEEWIWGHARVEMPIDVAVEEPCGYY